MAKERTHYSPWVKQQVRLRYPGCRTTKDKEELARELGILDADGNPSVPKLYNLASRLSATGRGDAENVLTEVATADERLTKREDPDTTTWSSSAESYLKREFGKRTVEWIGVHVKHTETAVVYKARQMGLRQPIKHWNARKVAFWLSLSIDELHALRDEGLDIYGLHDRQGKLQVEVVSATSLGRWLHEGSHLQDARARGGDEFFLREILETLEDLAAGTTSWERCKFLSAGHICQNPYAMETSFGEFCTNTDTQRAGDDRHCTVKGLAIDDLRGNSSM